MPNSVAKQIELASLLAQQQMNELDAQTLADLLEIYQAAVDVIAASIHTAALGSNVVRIEQLADLRQQVEQHLVQLNAQRQALLNDTLPLAAELGSKPFTPAIELNTLSRINHDAVRFVREFKAADGLQLSDRIWRINRGAREKLISEIELAVVQGHSANQAARAMLARGETPNIVGIDAAQPEKIARATADILTGQGGSAYHNAARVFRTELNRAHGTAYLNSAEQTPGCIGTRFLLSRAHPKVDICDTHASADLYGLGKGVYPHGKNPWPAHPNTLSYVVAVFDPAVYTPEVGANTMAGMDNRDETTKRYFNQSNISVDYDGIDPDMFEDIEKIKRLAGAPDGSHITISRRLTPYDGVVLIVKNTELFDPEAEYTLYKDKHDQLNYLFNEGPFIKHELQNNGIGTRSIVQQLFAAKEMGIDAVHLEASGSANSWLKGYYVWPRMGFDAKLPTSVKSRLPSHLSGANDLSDLFDSELGRKWWYDNGVGIEDVTFDLSNNSKSWLLLHQYMKERNIRI